MYSEEYGKQFEVTERGAFDLATWIEKFMRAKSYRFACGWEKNANDAARIRRNDLPLRDIQAAPGWKGKFYKDPWLWKGIKWIVSMLTGAEIDVDLKAFDGFGDDTADIYETEVNYCIDQSKLPETFEECLYDRYYLGFGCVRGIWNTKRITTTYRTGQPRFDYVSPMDIWFDPNTRKKDKGDMRYFFHELRYDTKELKRLYPQYAEQIQSRVDEMRIEATDITKVVVIQYKNNVEIRKVYIQDENLGITGEFSEAEWYDMIEQIAGDSETQAKYQANSQGYEYGTWLFKGLWLDEMVSITGPLEVEEPAVFQAIVIPDLNLILQAPQYIGQEYSYFFLIGEHDPESAYPTSLATMMKDMQEISVVMMTVLVIQAVRMYKMEKLIQEGALANEKEYKERGYELGVNPIVKEDWQKSHPHTKAVEYLNLPEFPSMLMSLDQSVTNAQKTMTGAVDAAIGLSSYSGESGVKVAQLQMASRVYQKQEVEGWRTFIAAGCTWLKDMVALYRNYPHRIKGLDESNRYALVDVSTNVANRMDSAKYFVEVTIQESYEVVKSMERELYMSLKNDRMIDPIEYMRKLDIPNAEKKLEAAMKYYGDLDMMNWIKENPEARQIIAQFMQDYEAGNVQPGQSA